MGGQNGRSGGRRGGGVRYERRGRGPRREGHQPIDTPNTYQTTSLLHRLAHKVKDA